MYGKCIVADYNAVHKDKCLTEFMRLKDCYLVSGHVLTLNLLVLGVWCSKLIQRQAAAKKR